MTTPAVSAFAPATGVTSIPSRLPEGASRALRARDYSVVSPTTEGLAEVERMQSDPDRFRTVMSTIATQLQAAADEASKNGNSAAAQILSCFARQFRGAADRGTLPQLRIRGEGDEADFQTDQDHAAALYRLVASLGTGSDHMALLGAILQAVTRTSGQT